MDSEKREQAKHICMELTADGARVTNLSLSGDRLVLTIEAQLSDSQLKATDEVHRDDDRSEGARDKKPGGRSDTEFLDRQNDGDTKPLPPASTLAPGSSEAPSSGMAFQQSQGYPATADTIRRESAMDGADTVDTEEIQQGKYRQTDVDSDGPSHADTQPIEFTPPPALKDTRPIAPPFEPVRELTDTWDATQDGTTTDSIFHKQAELNRQLMIEPMPGETPAAGPGPEPEAPVISFGQESLAAQGVPTPAAAPAAPLAGPAGAPAVPPRIGGDITLGDDPLPAEWSAGPAPASFSEDPRPLTETWDGSSLSFSDLKRLDDGPSAISEDSSAFGGARHGEPQPTLSFGGDAEAPKPAPVPAPGAAPALTPGFDFAQTTENQGQGPAPLGLEPTPPPLGQEPHRAEPSAPVSPPPSVAEDLTRPGSEDMTVVGPSPFAMDVDKLKLPPRTVTPAPAPAPTMPAEAPKPEPEPAPAPAPTPDPQPAPAKDGSDSGDKEPGGTTVLIRYTCPKCKTQGMQAVDKVGTVVNCSNCGKAMRLVMKK